MSAGPKLMHREERSFEETYRTALLGYTLRADEMALKEAYELGRRALQEGKSLVALTSFHQNTLLEFIEEGKGGREESSRILRAGAEFLLECLSPYEMAHRGFQDAVKALRQLNETLENEIKRIAYAVHDEAGQLIATIHLALAELAQESNGAQRQRLAQVEQLLHEVGKQLRRYSHELRPTILDDLGWIPAIQFLAEGVTERTNLPISVSAPELGRLPAAVETALYRVVQEALTNVTRHAKASQVSVEVRQEGGRISCWIRDDGRGFDVEATRSVRNRSGLGLIGMEERLHAVGGRLRIESAPGQGTRLLIEVPVEGEQRDANSSPPGG